MKANLFRFRVDGRAVGSINTDGEVEWEDLDALKNFADRFLRVGLSQEDPDPGVTSVTAVDVDLMSQNPTRARGASIKLGFNQVERPWTATL